MSNIKQEKENLLVIITERTSIEFVLSNESLSEIDLYRNLFFLVFNFNHIEKINKYFSKKNIEIIYFRDLLKARDLDEIDEYSYYCARNWFKVGNISKNFSFKNIIIPEILENEFSTIFIRSFLHIRTLKNFFKKERNFDSVINFSDDKIQSNVIAGFLNLIHFNCNTIEYALSIKSTLKNKTLNNIFSKISRLFQTKIKFKNQVIVYQPHFSIDPIIKNLDHSINPVNIYEFDLSILKLFKYKILKTKISQFVLAYRYKNLTDEINKISNIAELDSASHFDGINWMDLIREDIVSLIRNSYLDCCKIIDNIDNIIKKHKPKLFITSTFVTPVQRIIFNLAKKKEIPTVAMLHGLFSLVRRSSEIIYSDYLVIWGEKDKEIFEKLYPGNVKKCFVAGNPQFDNKINESNKQQIYTKIKMDFCIPRNSKIVLFVSNYAVPYSSYDGYDSIEWGINLIRDYIESSQDENIFLIIKRHPLDFADKLYNNIKSDKVAIVKDYSFDNLMIGSDLIITFPFSTAGLYAISLNKPFLLIRLFDFPYEIPYFTYGTTDYANTVELLISHISEMLLNDINEEKLVAYKKFYLNFSGPNDGLSIVRIADFIKKLI